MKTITNSYIKKNGWDLGYEWEEITEPYYEIPIRCTIYAKTSSTKYTIIGKVEFGIDEEMLTLYYRLPWIVMNKIYKYLDEQEDTI